MIDNTATGRHNKNLGGGATGNHFPDFHHDRTDLFEARIKALEDTYKITTLEGTYEPSRLEQLEQRIKELEDRMDALTGPPENVDPLKTVL